MRRVLSAACGSILAIVLMLSSTLAIAQNNANPFGSILGEGIDVAQLVPAEPAPEAALPTDPVPKVQIAVQVKAGGPAGASEDFCRCVGEDTSAESAARIRTALRRPLKEDGLEFTDQPLEEAVGFIQESYGIPIKLDFVSLKNVDIQPDKPITVNVHGISLGSAMRLMLDELNLTYVIHNEVLLITTRDREEVLLQTCVYDVRDLLQSGKKGNDFDTLIDSIVSTVATESWAENGGGEAEIRPLQPGFLIISQTQAVHDEIRGLLSTVRQLKSLPVAAAAAQPQTTPAEEVVTMFYPLQFANSTVNDALREQVRDLIVKALPEERWDGNLAGGQSVFLAVLNDRVVLRHKPAVQEKVEQLLVDSGMAATGEPGRGARRGRHGAGSNGVSVRNDRQIPPK